MSKAEAKISIDTPQEAVEALKQLRTWIMESAVSAGKIRREICENAVDRNSGVIDLHWQLQYEDKQENLGALMHRFASSDQNITECVDVHKGELIGLSGKCEDITGAVCSIWNEQARRLNEAEAKAQSLAEDVAALAHRLKQHAPHSSDVRETVWNMTGGKCFHCEVELIRNGEAEQATDRSRVFHVDHLVPKSVGGPDHLSNYVPACERCNISKGAKSYVEFRATRAQPVQLTVIEGGAALQEVVG
jgi:hypothetical protein